MKVGAAVLYQSRNGTLVHILRNRRSTVAHCGARVTQVFPVDSDDLDSDDLEDVLCSTCRKAYGGSGFIVVTVLVLIMLTLFLIGMLNP